jgi:hypothetical protein
LLILLREGGYQPAMTLFQWIFLVLFTAFAIGVLVALRQIKESLYVNSAQVDTLRRHVMQKLKD